MHDLVRLAEKREKVCREEMTRLLANRSTMLESAAAAAAGPTPSHDGADGEADTAAAGQLVHTHAVADQEPDIQRVIQRIEVAEKEMEEAQVNRNKYGAVSVVGMGLLLQLVQEYLALMCWEQGSRGNL
jgi:hypothetical protein